MSNKSTKQPVFPRIPEFYEGKSVFITGATGFLGLILLECLLKYCPGIERIYILIRTKKGIKPEQRKEIILNKTVFSHLRSTQPELLKKVHVVEGDVSQPDLGMDEIGLLKVIQNASVVFHCAASISFLRPLRYILSHNSGGTQHVINVCRKMRKLDALVYTSTAFSNCNRLNVEIEEKIYRLPFHSNKFLDELWDGKDSSLQRLVNQCLPNWPNFYSFSKCLAENIIQDNASDLPTAIVRPSLIGSTLKDPLPGYLEDSSGITALSRGTGLGFIKVLHGDPDVRLDLVPADVVAHVHLIAAMRAALERSSSPWIINTTSFLVKTLKEYTDVMLKCVKETPMPMTFRTPDDLKIVQNDFKYRLVSLYEHYIPAFVFDLFLKISGSKIRLIAKYKFVESAIGATYYFMTNSWNYERENLRKCFIELHPEDKQMLGTSYESDKPMAELIKSLPENAPFWNWNNDKKSQSERMFVAKQRYWFTTFIQATSTLVLCGILYVLSSLSWKLVY